MPTDTRSSWKDSREAQDSAAAWAIPRLRGVTKEDRLSVLARLITSNRLDVTAEELNRWCRRYEQPDIASGLVNKDTEAQAAIIEHRAVTQSADSAEPEEDLEDEAVSRHRAEGFRAFAELIAPEAESVGFRYPGDVRKGSGYARDAKGKRLCHMRYKHIGKGVEWQCLQGGGTVTLRTGEVVAYLTSVTIGIRDGEIVWALPEVGPERLWERKGRGELAYHVKEITRGINPKVVGIRALGLARRHAPGALDHSEGADLAKQLGLKSRQLLHYHETNVEEEIQKRTRRKARRVSSLQEPANKAKC